MMAAGAAVVGGTLYFVKKKIWGSGPPPEEPEPPALPETVPEVTLPAIVSDVDGVVVRGKEPVPGAREALEKLLGPHRDTGRRIPFTFMTNGGGAYEAHKAQSLNEILGLAPSFMGRMVTFGSGSGPKITSREMTMCQTVLKSKYFLDRFRDKWVLVDGYAQDDVGILESYGYRKVISLKELLSLEIYASMWIGVDL